MVTPDEHTGIVLGDLSSRRAAILNVSPREDMKLVMAHVPLACLIVSNFWYVYMYVMCVV